MLISRLLVIITLSSSSITFAQSCPVSETKFREASFDVQIQLSELSTSATWGRSNPANFCWWSGQASVRVKNIENTLKEIAEDSFFTSEIRRLLTDMAVSADRLSSYCRSYSNDIPEEIDKWIKMFDGSVENLDRTLRKASCSTVYE